MLAFFLVGVAVWTLQASRTKGRAIAGVAAVEPEIGEMYEGGGLSGETIAQVEATAILFAAAPDLLAALERIRDSDSHLGGTFVKELQAIAREAIPE